MATLGLNELKEIDVNAPVGLIHHQFGNPILQINSVISQLSLSNSHSAVSVRLSICLSICLSIKQPHLWGLSTPLLCEEVSLGQLT
jgi:hypothetical protein